MPNQVRLTDGTLLTITDKPFKEGGEGGLYGILSPATYQKRVVKLYHTDKRTPDRESKLAYLIANPPNFTTSNEHHSVIWPSQIVYQNNKFAGFTMPLATGETLEYLCYKKLPPTLGTEWQRFSFQSPDALKLRLNICLNIAIALQQIHSLGRYVLVDLKPENLLVQSKTLVHIIDIDSIQIRQNGQLLFPASASTPDYTPPEGHRGLDLTKIGTSDAWDRFGIAVIFYRLLFGLHPFVGTCHSPFDTCTGLVDMIRNGLFPHSPTTARHFKVVPNWHQGFLKLDQPVRELFIRCFDAGHTDPAQRPTTEDWCRVLAPKPVIDLKRALPAALAKWPNFTPSTGLGLPPSNWPGFPNVSYLSVQETNTFQRVIYGLFGKPKKENLREQVLVQQQKVREQASDFLGLKTTWQQAETGFTKTRGMILHNESSTVTRLRKEFTTKIAVIDNRARELQREEIYKIQLIMSKVEDDCRSADETVKKYINTFITPIGKSFQLKETDLLNQIENISTLQRIELMENERQFKENTNKITESIERLRQNYITKILKKQALIIEQISGKRKDFKALEKQKKLEGSPESREDRISSVLNNYEISYYAKAIFTDNYADVNAIVANLKSEGIRTAADFTKIDEEGKIRRKNGIWTKVPQVGQFRAISLGNWRDNLERIVSQKVSKVLTVSELKKLKDEFQIKYDELDSEETNCIQQAECEKAQIKILIAPQIAEAERQKQVVRQESERQQEMIRQKYASQKKALEQQLIQLPSERNAATSSVRKQLDQLMKESAIQQAKYKADYEQSRIKLTQFYDQKHKELSQEVADSLLFAKNEVVTLNSSTKARLEDNLNLFLQQSRQQQLQAQLMLEEVKVEINLLMRLQNQYSRMIT